VRSPGGATKQLAFTREEYEGRVERVRAEMQRRECDALIVDSIESINYLTGFTISGTRYQACLVFLDRDPVMVLRSLDEQTLVDSTWLSDYVLFGDSEDPVRTVAQGLKKFGVVGGRVGLELDSNFLTVKLFHQIQGALPDVVPIDFSEVVWDLRLHKSPAEVELIRRAAWIASEAMTRVMDSVARGVGERCWRRWPLALTCCWAPPTATWG